MSLSEASSLSSVVQNGPVPPPPPMPPLPLCKDFVSKEAEKSKGQVSMESLSAEEQGRKAYQNLLTQRLLLLSEGREATVLSCYNPLKPVLQNGPVCGLVALSMASQFCNSCQVATDDIFCEAHKRGYSKQGEIFSVEYLKELSSHFLSCRVEHLFLQRQCQSGKYDKEMIIRHLLQRNVILLPYDADKNHGPCQKRGEKAHWAVIAGIVISFSHSASLPASVKSKCSEDVKISSLIHWPEDPPFSLCEELSSIITSSQIEEKQVVSSSGFGLYVYGHQGKSKHAGLWRLEEVLQSNAQLEEAGSERSEEDYVFPPGGVAAGLKSQVLILKRRGA
ncbi:upf0692 protein c19orf54 homolog [Plakobranchus ocellatus]|uniref:Actin maturation protease n=1 Tax=Plakobranchus ocellatus TaxID=259542 RepID=A0AAV4C4N0_9GAST|nr:upf0692 protein c19orf54 homolog [Plakobranchus ocellatus]